MIAAAFLGAETNISHHIQQACALGSPISELVTCVVVPRDQFLSSATRERHSNVIQIASMIGAAFLGAETNISHHMQQACALGSPISELMTCVVVPRHRFLTSAT